MTDLTEFSVTDTIALLSRTPSAVNALLRGLPNIWVLSNEGEDTWSAFDIVGHLICADRTDWRTTNRGHSIPLTALRS